MATQRLRLNRKTENGSYDTIHYETESQIVERPNGKDVEESLASLETHVTNKNNPHGVSLDTIGAAAASHTHHADDINAGTLNVDRIPSLNASKISGGTLGGMTVANPELTGLDIPQIRNISATVTDPGAGSALPAGSISLVYEK